MVTQNSINGWTQTVIANATSTSVEFINIPPTITYIELVVIKATSTAVNSNFLVQFSVNNGSSYEVLGYTSGYTYFGAFSGTSNLNNGVLINALNPAASLILSANIAISGMNTVGISPCASGTSSMSDKRASVFGGILTTQTNANAFRITNLIGGTITGIFKAYGFT